MASDYGIHYFCGVLALDMAGWYGVTPSNIMRDIIVLLWYVRMSVFTVHIYYVRMYPCDVYIYIYIKLIYIYIVVCVLVCVYIHNIMIMYTIYVCT